MDQTAVLNQTWAYVQETLAGEGSGHAWRHIQRVWRNALQIAQGENVDLFVVQLAALLHDIADWKFHGGDLDAGSRAARMWLEQLGVDEPVIAHVCAIVGGLSFKGADVATTMRTREGMIVQDADRLDAMGAIGIARAFAYGGYKGRAIHDPATKPQQHANFEQYKHNTGPTINHFYEKLLLLKDRMNTETGRSIAAKPHAFMEQFLDQFLREWEGDR
jgi:uncharacterized protein